jgi:hypothetical protein
MPLADGYLNQICFALSVSMKIKSIAFASTFHQSGWKSLEALFLQRMLFGKSQFASQ